MSGLQGKRKRQDLASQVSSSLTNEERVVYNIIHAKKEMGIWQGDIKRETNIPDTLLKKSLKSLHLKSLIKEVVNIKNKSKKLFMASEFEPPKEITGGEWYTEGKLDTQFISALSEVCFRSILNLQVATLSGILEWTKKTGVFSGEVSEQQVEHILKILVLENKVQRVESSGVGSFSSVPIGKVCYRVMNKSVVKVGAMASIPCGVCPRINICSPDGIVSPRNCAYYQKWLEF